MKPAALGAAIVTTALVLAARASAAPRDAAAASESESEAVSLMFDEGAPPGCPSEADFKAEVTKLTSKARFTKSKRARRIRIELDSRGNEVVGRFVTGDGKNQSSREVRGKDCKEVSSALAIAVALTIDPEALGPSDSEPPNQPPEPKPAEPKPAEPKPTEPKPAEPKPAERSRLHWGLGAGLTFQSAWAPQMRPGGELLGVFGLGDRFRLNVGALYFPAREVEGVSFSALMGQGSLSWNIAVLGILRPYAALGYQAGAVDASGSGLSTKVEAQRRWQALSASLGLRFETEGFFLQLGGSLLVPISRQRYLISDSFGNLTAVHENPRFGLKQETSLGVFL